MEDLSSALPNVAWLIACPVSQATQRRSTASSEDLLGLQERQAGIESMLAQQAALVAQHVRHQAPQDDTAAAMPLPEDIDSLKKELSACTAAAKHASSLQVYRLGSILQVSQLRLVRVGHTPSSACSASSTSSTCIEAPAIETCSTPCCATSSRQALCLWLRN